MRQPSTSGAVPIDPLGGWMFIVRYLSKADETISSLHRRASSAARRMDSIRERGGTPTCHRMRLRADRWHPMERRPWGLSLLEVADVQRREPDPSAPTSLRLTPASEIAADLGLLPVVIVDPTTGRPLHPPWGSPESSVVAWPPPSVVTSEDAA